MWIITTRGFLSVVQKADAQASYEALLVRGRVRPDLDHLAPDIRGHRP
jgi:hypothetical protein